MSWNGHPMNRHHSNAEIQGPIIKHTGISRIQRTSLISRPNYTNKREYATFLKND
jgi:hypothetical protein